MKHVINVLMMATLLAVCGCGHSVLVQSKMTGLGAIFPVADGQTVGFILGSMESTTATVRGGTTVETTSVAGGGLFSGEQTNAQFNEGNIRDVLMSENVPEAAKIIIASNLVHSVKAPDIQPTVIQAQTASIHSGSDAVVSNNVPMINHTSGVDNLVNQIASMTTSVASNVTGMVTDTTGHVTGVVTDITNNTVDSIQESSTGIFDSVAHWFRDIKWASFFKVILGLLAALMTYFFFKGKKEVSIPVLKETNPNKIVPPLGGSNQSEPSDQETPPSDDAPVEPVILEPQEEKKEEEPPKQEEEKKEETPKVPWYKKVVEFFIYIYGLIMRIPAPQRRKIIEYIRRVVTDIKAKKKSQTNK